MRQQIWKRLEVVEAALQIQHRQIVLIRRDEKETDSDFDAKIERWKAGESVEGIDAEYQGSEIEIISIRSVSSRPR